MNKNEFLRLSLKSRAALALGISLKTTLVFIIFKGFIMDFKIVKEEPIITESINATTSPDFFLEAGNFSGVSTPSMSVMARTVQPRVVVLRICVTVVGKKTDETQLFSIEYISRAAFWIDREVTADDLESKEFVQTFSSGVYQRIADRVTSIAADMGLSLSMPIAIQPSSIVR